jgi:Permease for cytosine/purines, uracil, thiamine, allantoin
MSAGEQLSAGNLATEDEATPAGLVEQHHIGVIPDADRHGRPRDQFTLWFAANANVVNITLGVLAIVFGLNLFWALVAIVAGNVLGMLLTALHAWQGPRLGVPQMIQSRGQFGFYGASFIILVSIVLDIGYLAASQVLQGDSLNLLWPAVNVQGWIIITLPALALAIFGYRWIHGAQKVMTAIFAVVIVITLIQAATYGPVLHQYRGTHLSSGPILVATIGLFFMNMLSWAIYVSDYSRCLPRNVSFQKTFWAIFLGNVVSTTLFAALGAWVATLVPTATRQPAGRAGQGVRAVGHVLHGDQPDPRGHAQRLHRHDGVRQPGQQQQELHGRPAQAGGADHRHPAHLRDRHGPGLPEQPSLLQLVRELHRRAAVLLRTVERHQPRRLLPGQEGPLRRGVVLHPQRGLREVPVVGVHLLRDHARGAGTVPGPDLLHRSARREDGRCGYLLDRRIRHRIAAIPGGGEAFRDGREGLACG